MRWLLAAAVALPGLVLAVLGWFHPPVLTPDTAQAWWTLHVVLLPIFPLLAGSLWLLLRGRRGVVPALARVAGYGYAVGYTALDALAGIAAGLVVQTEGRASQAMLRLFDVGNVLGLVGAGCFLGAVLLTCTVLLPGGGPVALVGGAVLVLSSLSFLDSHIYPPRGVATMLGIAVGCALLALAGGGKRAAPSDQQMAPSAGSP